ncbi:MAG: DNA mismatch repair endonuclease MutL [candidate division WS1 bacterium]|nr:DNA mismatch repair endonuclease MutL [candidate division WS1 bacterium]
MSAIVVLSEQVANRIAAGEVVERPASVVKELVENAMDAGATRIDVRLAEGGKQLIRVTDDGVGMSPDDLMLAVQRFATSKITAAEDLDAILTMGFRGEALPSIAAVAQLQITSRQADTDEACRLVVRGGGEVQQQTVAAPVGTDVEVTHLFFNTPARQKFLATTATERGHCVNWAHRLALGRPDIAFRVTHDGQNVLTTSGNSDLQAVIAAIWGSNDARLFLPLQMGDSDFAITGYVSSPRLTRANRHTQLFFVNGRFVRSSSLSHALTQAYGMLLPSGRQPMCVIHIQVSPHIVDPNVHPTKIEVRFDNPGRVHDLCARAVGAALAEAGLRPLDAVRPPMTTARDELGIRQPAAGRWSGPGQDQIRRAARLRINPFVDSVDERDAGLELYTSAEAPHTDQQALSTGTASAPHVLGQLSARYIVAQSGTDLLLIDQHRAAERVLLLRMSDASQPVARQLLAVPLSMELSPEEAAAAEDHAQSLQQMGFELEQFGPSAWLLRSVPTMLVNRSYEPIIRDLLQDLASWQAPSSFERAREELAALVACHGAIKAGTKLTAAEMQGLVDDLTASDAPAVCPHGDPIIITVSSDQLDRKFGRA